jgi:hypothetical protein
VFYHLPHSLVASTSIPIEMFHKILFVLAAASSALASVSIVQPTATTVFNGGQQATIQWQESGSAPTLAQFGPSKISIYTGNSQQQTSLQLINANVDVSTTSSLTFNVDPTIGPNSNQYFIRVESLSLRDPAQPNFPALAFSAKFTLANMSGTFSADVIAQISGNPPAPGAAPTVAPGAAAPAGGAGGAAPNGAATTITSKVTITSGTPTKSATTSAKPTSGANALRMGSGAAWIGAVVGVVAGVAMF